MSSQVFLYRRVFMRFIKIVKLECFKLLKKKTTWLLLLNLGIPLLYGVGMFAGASFLVSDGVSDIVVIGQGLSAMEFLLNMLTQNQYILYFIVIVISAMALSNELENGQIRTIITRICNRRKIILAKYLSILFMTFIALCIFMAVTLLIYYTLVCQSAYASGSFWGSGGEMQLLSLLFTFIGLAVMVAVTILLGLFFKTFLCFAISYILWIVLKYVAFFDSVKLLSPDKFTESILENTVNSNQIVLYGMLFIGYCVVLIALSAMRLNKMDIK